MKKRILSILLTLCMVLMLVPATAFADELLIKGDVDFDGQVSILDATRLQNYLEGLESFTKEQLVVADFNGDGVVNYSDLTELQSYIELPVIDITVENGKATACGTEISKAALHTRVTLTANSPSDDMEFDKWIVNEGGVTLADASSATTTFTMLLLEPVSVTATYKPLSASETGSLAITVDGFQVGNTPNDTTLSFVSTNLGVTFSADDIASVSWQKYRFNGTHYDWYLISNTEVFEADTRYKICISMDNKGLTEAPAVTVNGNTPESCRIATQNGVPIQLQATCELGTPAPAPTITINGPDVICAEENYYFTATASEGVTFDELFGLGYGIDDYCSLTLGQEADGTAWGVVQTYYYSADSFELTVSGTTEDRMPVSAAKTVQVSPEHIYVDGVCGCGAVQPTLAITIDGFEVGNTPNDCTYTFDSTIPGVTFSKDDIKNVGWEKFVFDGYDYIPITVNNTEVFEADTSYRCAIELDNKGLDTVPAVTMNGKTPEYCAIVTKDGVPVALQMSCEFGTPPERSQYTITYEGGEGAEGSIPAGVKARGEDFTLSSDTFTREGFVQTGWVDKETGAIYELGATFDEDRDVTFYPVWEKLVTVTAGFTTTVALGDAGEPGETTFELGLIDSEGYELTFDDQFIGAEITTDGAGSYSGTMTITATEKWLYKMLYEGAFIRQYDGEEAGWTYDDTVWGVRLYMPEVAARSADAVQYSLLLYPTCLTDDGRFDLDLNAGPVDEMTFTNTYTAHAYELNHDADGHWDECTGCGDKQNEEAHKYGDWTVTKEATETAVGEKEHTCTVCGYTETAEIAKLPATTDPSNPTDPSKPTESNPNTGALDKVPQTGDNSNMILWIVLLFASGLGVTGTVVYSKRKI